MAELNDLRDAVDVLAEAANLWCDYLEGNDRDDEVERYENALNLVDKILSHLW